MENKTMAFSRFLKFSGLFNIVAASLFMVPGLYRSYVEFYNEVNLCLGLGGGPIVTMDHPFYEMMVNTAGIDLVLIGVIVLLVSADPFDKIHRQIIVANGVGRTLFFFLVGYYTVSGGLLQIFIPFAVLDLFIAGCFFCVLYKVGRPA